MMYHFVLAVCLLFVLAGFVSIMRPSNGGQALTNFGVGVFLIVIGAIGAVLASLVEYL